MNCLTTRHGIESSLPLRSAAFLGLACCLLLTACSPRKPVQPPADARSLTAFDEFLLFAHRLKNTPPPPGAYPNETYPGFFYNWYEMDDLTMREVGRVASGYAKAVGDLEAKAAATMKSKWTPAWAKALRDGKRLPDTPAELARIQQEKDTLTRTAIEDLETALGLAQVRYLRYELTVRPLRNFFE